MKKFLSGLKSLFKKYFLAGAAVFVPFVGTLWILKTLVLWLDNSLTSFIPKGLRPEALIGLHIPGIGLVLTIALILLVGILTRVYMGSKLIEWGDDILHKIPFGRGIYKALKQFLKSVVSQDGSSFKQAVMVEFPTNNTFMIGFISGAMEPKNLAEKPEKKLISVFIPTAPNPTSGFLVYIEEDKLKPLDVTPEEAFRMIISLGVVSDRKEN